MFVPRGVVVTSVLFPGVCKCLGMKRSEVQICKALMRPVTVKKCIKRETVLLEVSQGGRGHWNFGVQANHCLWQILFYTSEALWAYTFVRHKSVHLCISHSSFLPSHPSFCLSILNSIFANYILSSVGLVGWVIWKLVTVVLGWGAVRSVWKKNEGWKWC